MKQGTQIFLTIGLGLVFLQSGCAKKVTPVSGSAGLTEERPVGEVPSSGLTEERIKPSAAEENIGERHSSIDAASAGGGLDDIYFEYDQASLREESKSVLQKDAKFIPDAQVEIQGHTDERGSEEYNLALGQRRAQIVKRFLTALGVDGSRLQTISFGEEKPFCNEKEEGCWKQNRRAHFSVQSPR
jgi:peptidoglycan-associated lipoprotein